MSALPQLASSESSAGGLFRANLLEWYDRRRRDLPWRKDRDPYHVWISEIMLQQTRVAAVIDYYQRFLKRFPTIEKLAAARLSSVLALWSGLGYYVRARMLHKAARVIVKEHGGKFPRTAKALRELPGIGRYTASAIASIAFSEPVPVVDGNVERVLQRVTGRELGKEELWTAADDFLDVRRPGDFNQAMMELGATVCVPRQPLCLGCPVHALCVTHGSLPEAKRQTRKKKQLCYSLALRGGRVLLVKRPADASLMAGMWELPGLGVIDGQPDFTLRHSITDSDYLVHVWRVRARPKSEGEWVKLSRLGKLPLTGLARKILRAAQVIE